MSLGRVYAVFSCTGKTHFVLNNFRAAKMVDHDMYDWRYRGLLNNWATHYIDRLMELREYFDYVFVNAVPEIINGLDRDAVVVYPDRSLKQEWCSRAITRSGSNFFPMYLSQRWDEWIDACERWQGKRIEIRTGYLSDVLIALPRAEGIIFQPREIA